ncbi:MAG TPA: hypothetical protein VFA99_02445 [Acidobacteriaceae bacterium]|nr:hypothetical protein [Acidobacteriaceae bacterium]
MNQAAIVVKNFTAAVNPAAETISHHLLERMLAITGQTMLDTIANRKMLEISS